MTNVSTLRKDKSSLTTRTPEREALALTIDNRSAIAARRNEITAQWQSLHDRRKAVLAKIEEYELAAEKARKNAIQNVIADEGSTLPALKAANQACEEAEHEAAILAEALSALDSEGTKLETDLKFATWSVRDAVHNVVKTDAAMQALLELFAVKVGELAQLAGSVALIQNDMVPQHLRHLLRMDSVLTPKAVPLPTTDIWRTAIEALHTDPDTVLPAVPQ